MVAAATPHVLDHLLSLLGGQATLRRDNLAKYKTDFTSHVGSVTTNVKIRLLLKQIADKLCLLTEPVLNIDLLGSLSRECRYEFEVVAELILENL